MIEVIVAALGIVGLAVPVFAVSRRRRLLKVIAEETAALAAIDDPQARKALRKALRATTSAYLRLVTERQVVKARRWLLITGLPAYLAGAVAVLISRQADELTASDRAEDWLFWISMAVALVAAAIFTGFTIWYALARLEDVRQRRLVTTAKREAAEAQLASEQLAKEQLEIDQILANLVRDAPTASSNWSDTVLSLQNDRSRVAAAALAKQVIDQAAKRESSRRSVNQTLARDAAIAQMRAEGKNLDEIAYDLGITRERVRQILRRSSDAGSKLDHTRSEVDAAEGGQGEPAT